MTMETLPVTNDNSTIAVIKTNIEYIQRDINDIKLVLKDGYATKDSLIVIAKETETRLLKLESSRNLWKWLSPTFAAVMGSILTFLLIQYIMHI